MQVKHNYRLSQTQIIKHRKLTLNVVNFPSSSMLQWSTVIPECGRFVAVAACIQQYGNPLLQQAIDNNRCLS